MSNIEYLYIIASIAILPAILFALVAQLKVTLAFSKYSQVHTSSNMTGSQLATQLLRENNCDVRVECGQGHLTDHYDPRRKVVVLSAEVHNSSSVAALGIAAHEVGHAIQDSTNYPPLKIRQLVIKSSGLINKMLLPLIIIGVIGQIFFLFNDDILFYFLIALCITYALSFLVNLITLPTEFNASARAKRMIEEGNYLSREEQYGVSKVLTAAALTYVAALIVSLVYLLRFVAYAMIVGRRRN